MNLYLIAIYDDGQELSCWVHWTMRYAYKELFCFKPTDLELSYTLAIL
jgi:hypothetical protein